MTKQQYALLELGRWCLLTHCDSDCCDVDGSALQDKAEQLGLLERVTVSEPCGEACVCAEVAVFPQICIRLAAGVQS